MNLINILCLKIKIFTHKCFHGLSTSILSLPREKVPIIYTLGEANSLKLIYDDGSDKTLKTLQLSPEDSKAVFKRTGRIALIEMVVDQGKLIS